MIGRIIPTTGELFVSIFWHCLWTVLPPLAYKLGIKVYLNLTCHLGLNWFSSVYVMPLCYVIFLKVCPAPLPPVSCFFPEPHPGPQCCLYNILEGQQENSWPFIRKYCIMSKSSRDSGLHLPCFLQHVCQQHLSVNLRGRVIGPQCLLEVHLLASLQRWLGFQG